MNARVTTLASLSALIALTSCAAPGTENRSDTYMAGEVNQRQAIKVVTIISVSPARIQVDNTSRRRTAQIVGGILGAGLGAGLGTGVAHSTAAGALGGLGGIAAGAAGGSIVPGTTYVNGVQIAYQDGHQAFSSAQVGRLCEYGPGPATLIAMNATQTRIQPNRQCATK